jgi:Na+/melibiose symporter-like transporter
MTMDTSAGLPGSVRRGYALGSLVTGAFGTVPGLLLLPYFTDTLGVAAGLAGLLVLLPKAWDVLVNPVAGRISDRTRTAIGARRPYLLGGGISVAVLFALMFAGFLGTSGGAPAYVAVMFLLTATAYAFFQVPYVAMPAEMTDSYAERTRLMTWRVAVLALAILISGGLAPVVVKAGGDGVPGHRAMGVFVAVLMVLGTLGAFVGTRKARAGTVTESEPTLRAQLRVAGANRPFRLLLICWIVQAAGIATMLAGVNYFAEDVLKSEAAKSVLFVCFVAPALLVMPVWIRAGGRLGKRGGYVVASGIFVLGAALLAAAGFAHAPTAVAYAVTALIGAGYAGQQVFGLAMLPDCIAFDDARTGKRQAGVFTGMWTAGETFGLALGPYLFGQLIGLFGYQSSTADTHLPQDGAARLGITIGFTVVPAVLMALGLIFLRRYNLTAAKLAEVLQPAT